MPYAGAPRSQKIGILGSDLKKIHFAARSAMGTPSGKHNKGDGYPGDRPKTAHTCLKSVLGTGGLDVGSPSCFSGLVYITRLG